jgi:uroporphyrin-III C-methyltransferase
MGSALTPVDFGTSYAVTLSEGDNHICALLASGALAWASTATSDAIAEKLMADGLAPDMPIAVIENAARPTMRVLRGALAGLGALVEEHKVKSPALIVIGEVTARERANELLKIAETAA